MNTIEELEKYLENECYSFRYLTIGKHHASEGIVIEKAKGEYCFAFSERGKKELIQSFRTEKELVDYALNELAEDKWSRAHLVAWAWKESEIKEAEKELNRMNIEFIRNDVPNYSRDKHVYRIFVFGRDILGLDAFRAKFMRQFFN
ncbi:MAG: hypothetical protein HFI34_03765 [Lachnospiraceae bacterium]|nr:hypothetical protein [Lachnospiraceae bacterium]